MSPSTNDFPTTFVLQPSQVSWLKTKVDEYRGVKGSAKRKAFARRISQQLRNEMNSISGSNMSQAREEALNMAVQKWFESHKLDKHTTPRNYSTNWHPHLVLKYRRTRAISHLANLILHDRPLPDLRRLIEDEDTVIREAEHMDELVVEWENEEEDEDEDSDVDDDGEGGESAVSRPHAASPAQTTNRTASPFVKFSQATKMIWEAMTPAEQSFYERLAEQWKLEGPPRSEQRRLAEKKLTERCKQFATSLYNDMNARVFFFLGYEDTKAERLGVTLEYNQELTGKKPFQKMYEQELEKSGALDRWCEYVGLSMADETEVNPAAATRKATPNQKAKPLLPMKVDKYGRPILPPLSEKPVGYQKALWIIDILRSYFTRHWVLALGEKALPPNIPEDFDRSSVHWSDVHAKPQACISEKYLPSDILKKFHDPSQMPARLRRRTYTWILERQADPKVKTVFEFKAIPVKRRDHNNREIVVYQPSKMRLEIVDFDQSDSDDPESTAASSTSAASSSDVELSSSDDDYDFEDDARGGDEVIDEVHSSSDDDYDFGRGSEDAPGASSSSPSSTSSSSTSRSSHSRSPSAASQVGPASSDDGTDSSQSSVSSSDGEYDFQVPEEKLPSPALSSSDDSDKDILPVRPVARKRMRLDITPADERALNTPRQTRSGTAKEGEGSNPASSRTLRPTTSSRGGRGATRGGSVELDLDVKFGVKLDFDMEVEVELDLGYARRSRA
ncbi:hypothetical protein CC1G_13317 [Coprinopsis cinerea okayama7|uniref:Uncharacterized protein n=1 Tax=Coprinopsis cinerea (strain Okayama-7 / 130 / ATCC MYA-4618 / FGSC 9003) TaxID=240176 RepID=A8PGW3_COPC7|nr:hypothetical protein CC1G_13317 [Coprinopsis cinerea okayama7\|eukprot:XP_001841292.2 hypothetical protein CC1G_13317 [Coprinopsis cinerea okayama7\